jgi:hypothetical protein
MRCICGVTTCNKMRVAPEILQLDIKYHMTVNLLVGWRNSFIPIQYLKCNADILHLLSYCILPNSVAILIFKLYAVFLILWEFNSKLVSPLVISLCHSGNDTTALLEHIWDPPNKIRSIKKVLGDRVLSNLHRVAFFEV